ncbi:uncharacterized protein YjbI with pentapeptide repeats [Actinokineospora baliensis]|uniref:pentapeptide repeat-containing protein n=1 Tax=Actinokineospora baliensis TaxID=547056 RepID=UPI0019595A63|nr:pentapeptide repeat-containing protein [Actinokineospora baliensis]MBM7774250.1 uncharacterized protein YjbI with pentapeptide repeats [Actinokineospora baliensis]
MTGELARRQHDVSLREAVFETDIVFDRVVFGRADFSGAIFQGHASFLDCRFEGLASFEGARFEADAMFGGSHFQDNAVYSGTVFAAKASFTGASFGKVAWLGPLVADQVDLEGAQFDGHVEVVAETSLVQARRVRFEDTAIFRLRYAVLGLEGANFGVSSSISGGDRPFVAHRTGPVAAHNDTVKGWLRRQGREDLDTAWNPLLVSVRDSDVGNLVLTDVDLRWCQFAGARRLDQLQMEGRCPLNVPPPRRGRASRAVLAEEHFWRARGRSKNWTAEHPLGEQTSVIRADRLAALYRSLRKAFEDGKNEAGAGDFYYGEMEARRHATTTTRPERWILTAYWALSGYGQRASRAFAALLLLIATVTILLVGWGIPTSEPQRITGTVQPTTALTVAEQSTALPAQRWTLSRAEKALQLATGAVAFRDAGQKLTAVGMWTVTSARLTGPLLLALAALAIRARVKR